VEAKGLEPSDLLTASRLDTGAARGGSSHVVAFWLVRVGAQLVVRDNVRRRATFRDGFVGSFVGFLSAVRNRAETSNNAVEEVGFLRQARPWGASDVRCQTC
jgi:hypothetical protein